MDAWQDKDGQVHWKPKRSDYDTDEAWMRAVYDWKEAYHAQFNSVFVAALAKALARP